MHQASLSYAQKSILWVSNRLHNTFSLNKGFQVSCEQQQQLVCSLCCKILWKGTAIFRCLFWEGNHCSRQDRNRIGLFFCFVFVFFTDILSDAIVCSSQIYLCTASWNKNRKKRFLNFYLRGSALLTVEKTKESLLGFGCWICSKIGVLAH